RPTCSTPTCTPSTAGTTPRCTTPSGPPASRRRPRRRPRRWCGSLVGSCRGVAGRAAAAQVVRLSHRVRPQAEAEAAAVAAVQRFPRSPEVLWQVAMHCANPAQYARVWATWQQSARADDLVRVVRQLTVAAARSGEVAAACDLYRQAVQ